jgi:hypothetical protein
MVLAVAGHGSSVSDVAELQSGAEIGGECERGACVPPDSLLFDGVLVLRGGTTFAARGGPVW